jgi:hypothetical protein
MPREDESRLRGWLVVVPLVAVAVTGCVGRLSGGNGGSPAAARDTPAPRPAAAGQTVFRRLTRAEYAHTVRDLLGEPNPPPNPVPVDTASGRSGFSKGGSVSWVGAGYLIEATEKLAARAMKRLDTFLPCKGVPALPAEQDRCAVEFITRFGRRAYRRPVLPVESADLMKLYRHHRSEVGPQFSDAIRVVMTAILLSPNFLYRWELAPGAAIADGPLLRLNPHELASRLSYFIWATMPDEQLFAAADSGRLATTQELERQARRMLKDPKARDGVAEFFVQWLDVTYVSDVHKNKKVFKQFSGELARAMLEETRDFVADLMLEGDGRLPTLLTSNVTSVNEGLARLYGLPDPTRPAPQKTETAAAVAGSEQDDDEDDRKDKDKDDGASGGSRAPVASAAPPRQPLVAARLDPSQRAGILTHASFLAAHASGDHSNPVKRGVLVADRVLCLDLPSPPDDVPDPKPPGDGLSTRERFAEHGKNECATACHDLFDPLGFAFENYDAIGGYRAEDGGKPVDATGSFTADGIDKDFVNAVDLVGFLAKSTEVHNCMVRQWLRYGLRRREVSAEEKAIERIQEQFRKSSDLRELVVAIATSPAFTHRVATPGEPAR